MVTDYESQKRSPTILIITPVAVVAAISADPSVSSVRYTPQPLMVLNKVFYALPYPLPTSYVT